MVVGSGMQTSARLSRTLQRKKEKRLFSFFSFFLPLRTNAMPFDLTIVSIGAPLTRSRQSWRSHPRQRKEKFIRIFYCLLLQLAHMRPRARAYAYLLGYAPCFLAHHPSDDERRGKKGRASERAQRDEFLASCIDCQEPKTKKQSFSSAYQTD